MVGGKESDNQTNKGSSFEVADSDNFDLGQTGGTKLKPKAEPIKVNPE